MPTSDEILHIVLEGFGQVFQEDRLDADSDFFDLGGDSVSLVSLCVYLEGRLGTELHPSLVLYHSTVGELARELSPRAS